MKSVWARMLCRLLMVLMVWSPMQLAQAGLIGTDRSVVVEFLDRAEVARELQSLGVDLAAAKDRVAAMTDQEVQEIAGRIQAVPAGASDAATIIIILLIAAAVWWIWFRR